jgi:hypothetical protein
MKGRFQIVLAEKVGLNTKPYANLARTFAVNVGPNGTQSVSVRA